MSSNLIGKTIGQYTILEEIGRGGMATVYSAMQTSMNRKVAIKVLPPHFMHDPGFMERFEREVEVISHLEHPHILPIYDYGQAENVPFIAMRFLGGGSMAQLIRRGEIALEAIEKPFSQVCQALDYAHQQGIIHRDLKPGNIMLDENGNAYLSDFGIARVMGSNLTGSAIIGTPAYMSPEQAHGLSIDGRSDIYSMGVVLFELITGREPFQAETPMGLLLMHINEPLPPIQEFREEVGYTVQEVVEKATAKNPDDRFSSAGELAQAFSAALRGETLSLPRTTPARTRPRVGDEQATMPPARSTGTGGTVIGGATATPGSGRSTIPGPTLPRTRPETGTAAESATLPPAAPARSRWPLLLAALVIVAAGLIAGVVLLTAPDNAPATPAAVLPTPFRSAVTVRHDTGSYGYSISIPQRWMPIAADYIDRSDATRMVHLWQSEDRTAAAALVITELSAADYSARFYDARPDLRLVDESTAPDTTQRRSYRVIRDTGSGFAPGQLDVFYRQRPGQLIVLELYTADSVATDSTILTTLQLILDSLRVTAAPPAA